MSKQAEKIKLQEKIQNVIDFHSNYEKPVDEFNWLEFAHDFHKHQTLKDLEEFTDEYLKEFFTYETHHHTGVITTDWDGYGVEGAKQIIQLLKDKAK